MHRVGEMSERDFRTNRFCGDNECPATGKDDTGAPLFEFKKQLDTLGRGYPACTAVLASNKSKIFKSQDVVAIEAKLKAETDARGPATKEASRLRGDLFYKEKEQGKRNEMAAQALSLIESLVTRPLFARFQPLIDAAKADTEQALDSILDLMFDEFAGEPSAIREAVIAKFHAIGYAETPAELSAVITQFKAVDAHTGDWLRYYDTDDGDYAVLDPNNPPLTNDFKLRRFAALLGPDLQRFKTVVETAIDNGDDLLPTLDGLGRLLRATVRSLVPSSSSSSSSSASSSASGAAVHVAPPVNFAAAPPPAPPHVATGAGGGQARQQAMLAAHSDEQVWDLQQAAFAAGQVYADKKRPAPAPAAPYEAPKMARIEQQPGSGYGGGGGGGSGGGGGQHHAPPPPLPPAPAPPHPYGPAGCPHWDGFRCDFESKKRLQCRNAASHVQGRSTYDRPYVPQQRPPGGF